jgi:Tfp pilus assembly protein PilF
MLSSRSAIGILLLGTFLLYGQTLFFEFVAVDDPTLVLENRILHQLTFESFCQIWNPFALRSQLGTEYLPLRDLSYAFDYYFWGLNPLGYHLTNLLFFALGVALLFFLLRQHPQTAPYAFSASFLFVIHPLHCESVAWVSSRKDVLALFFFLATLLSFPPPQDRAIPQLYFSKKRYFCAFFCFLAGLLSKMTVVSLPCLLVLCYGKTWKAHPYHAFKALAPFFLLALFFAILSVWIGSLVGTVKWQRGVLESWAFLPLIFWSALLHFFFPVSLNLIYTPWPLWSTWTLYVGAGIAFLFFFYLLWRSCSLALHRFSLFHFCVYASLLSALPVSNLIPIPFLKADRYLLIPSIGACLLLSYLLGRCSRKYHLLAYLILGLSWSILTFKQLQYWQNSLRLGERTLQLAPHDPSAQILLADAYLAKEQYPLAEKYYQLLLNSSPQNWKALVNLGFLYQKQNRLEEALLCLKQAYALTKDLKETSAQQGLSRYNPQGKLQQDLFIGVLVGQTLALLFHRKDDFFSARRIAHEVYQKAPLWPMAPYTLALIYAKEGEKTYNAGRITNAKGWVEKALVQDPHFAEAHELLAKLCLMRGEYESAFQHFHKSSQLYLQEQRFEDASLLQSWIQKTLNSFKK